MKALALLSVACLGLLAGCSGASEGNTSQAADEIRKEVPKPTHEALPEDKTANVFGRTPIEGGGGK